MQTELHESRPQRRDMVPVIDEGEGVHRVSMMEHAVWK
jgi:hypothetical protein